MQLLEAVVAVLRLTQGGLCGGVAVVVGGGVEFGEEGSLRHTLTVLDIDVRHIARDGETEDGGGNGLHRSHIILGNRLLRLRNHRHFHGNRLHLVLGPLLPAA